MAEEELDGSQVAGAPVDQRGLGTPHGMGGVLEWVEANAAHPLGDQAGILPRREVVVRPSLPLEQALSRLSRVVLQVRSKRPLAVTTALCLPSGFGDLLPIGLYAPSM